MAESPDDKAKIQIAKDFLAMEESAGYRELLLQLRRDSFYLALYRLMTILDKSYHRGLMMGRIEKESHDASHH